MKAKNASERSRDVLTSPTADDVLTVATEVH